MPSSPSSRVDPGRPLIRAVLFDWGGTLTSFHSVDLIDAWRVAADVLAPDRVDEVAEALLAAEAEVWDRTRTSMRSARIHEVLATASEAVGLPVEYIPLLLTVDWFLDRCRTAINVMGDLSTTCLVDRSPPPAAKE